MKTALFFALPALSAAAAGPLDLCALITRSEASAALGAAVEPGSPERALGSYACRWYSPDGEKELFVTVVQARDVQRARSFGGRLVPGIGEEAVWALGSLFIRKGASCVQVGLHLSANSMKAMDQEILTLGRAVAGRM